MNTIHTPNERLGIAIKNAGISQRQLALKLGLHASSINQVVNGRSFLQFDLARQACEILGISMDWLAWGKEQDNTQELLTKLENLESGRAQLDYLAAIIDEMDKSSQEEIYSFTIFEMKKKITTVINRNKQTAEVTEEAL